MHSDLAAIVSADEEARARVTLEEQRQTLRVTEDKFRAGLAPNLQVLRARTEVEATAAEIPTPCISQELTDVYDDIGAQVESLSLATLEAAQRAGLL